MDLAFIKILRQFLQFINYILIDMLPRCKRYNPNNDIFINYFNYSFSNYYSETYHHGSIIFSIQS